MAELTHEQYDALERAIIDRHRVVVFRRGTEFIVTPLTLVMRDGRELVEALHPTTGEPMTFFIDEVESIDVV